MAIYRVLEHELGRLYMRVWWRRLLRTVGLLIATLAVCAIGLVVNPPGQAVARGDSVRFVPFAELLS